MLSKVRGKEAKIATVQCDGMKRTISVRLSGFLDEAEARRIARLYREQTDTFGGRPHLVLADVRGMKTQTAQVAAIIGEAIAYGRSHGVACCVHLSDSITARLQIARLASEVSSPDGITVECVSVPEAERVLEEKRRTLFGK